MAFLLVTTVLDALVHAFCWVRLVWITQHDDHPSFGEAIKREPAAIALIAYTFFAFGCAELVATILGGRFGFGGYHFIRRRAGAGAEQGRC